MTELAVITDFVKQAGKNNSAGSKKFGKLILAIIPQFGWQILKGPKSKQMVGRLNSVVSVQKSTKLIIQTADGLKLL